MLAAVILGALLRLSIAVPPRCRFDDGPLVPPYYVAYKVEPGAIAVDGDLEDPAWAEVAWTSPNIDICGPNQCSRGLPRFSTHQKVRWDDKFLYIAALLEEPQVWANNTQHDSVIFSDNDYEVFISPDGTSHYYKEYEMNARNANWDLLLNKPYSNGGYENSTRTEGKDGFDELPYGLKSGTKVHGCQMNVPTLASQPCRGWTAEVAMPLHALVKDTLATAPPRAGQYWRINFSRVEWKVDVLTTPTPHYQKTAVDNPGDNWVWAPTGVVDIHEPEYWGYLQFADGQVNGTAIVPDPDYSLRQVAMQVYYAQQAHMAATGLFTADIAELMAANSSWQTVRGTLNGTCTQVPKIALGPDKKTFTAYITELGGTEAGGRTASIRDDRYLAVMYN